MRNQAVNYEFEDYKLLTEERLLMRDGRPVSLKPKVLETLLALVRSRGRLMTKDELIGEIWAGNVVEEGNLTQYIFTLRKVFGETPQDHRFILTVPGQGYRFIAKVNEINSNNGFVTNGNSGSGKVASLAILPLKLLTVSESDHYLGLAIADALITRLSLNQTVTVRPTATIVRYSESDAEPVSIGRDLSVDAIVGGTIQKIKGKFHVNIQLTDVRTLKTIWARQFDADATDLISFQDQISAQVADSLTIELNRTCQGKKLPKGTQTYQMYLKGRFFWEKRCEVGIRKALNNVLEVVEAEPDFPLGHVGIADCYLFLGEYLFDKPQAAFPPARAAALKAVALDPGLAEAYASLGEYYFYYERNWAKAHEMYTEAIRLDPNYASAFHWYCWYLIAMNQYDEALVQIERAQTLDPNSLILNTIRGLPFYYRGEYEQAIRQFNDTLEIDPEFDHARYYLGSALVHSGKSKEAVTEFEKLVQAQPIQQFYGLLGYCYGVSGEATKARRILKELDRMEKESYISPYIRAIVHTGLGEKDKALEMLQRALDQNAAWLVWLNADPFFSSLRNEPKFLRIIQELKFPAN
ncbi:MAG: winged helix-turn-helix domain-containing tetratricopeptide repeat protein [Pyrinomonadaceae bacterium]